MGHSYYYNVPHGFIVFNDQALVFDPVEPSDTDVVTVSGPQIDACKSMTWSSGCEWFFVIREDSIVLLNVYSASGLMCRKKSSDFIRFCLDGGLLAKQTHSHCSRRTAPDLQRSLF